VLERLLLRRDRVVRVGPTPPPVVADVELEVGLALAPDLGGTLGAREPERERDPMGEGVVWRKWEGKLEGGGGGPVVSAS
jgi:hypothetical protein